MKGKRKEAKQPQGEPEEAKARGKMFSLHPLTPEEALRHAMKAGPMPPEAPAPGKK